MTTERVLDDFKGAWSLVRHITHGDGTHAEFRGAALLMPVAQGLAYEEKGWLRVGESSPFQAERRYHWDEALNVWFDDGQFFHAIPAMGGPMRHYCDPDTYAGEYDFSGWPKFTLTWQVTGPRKDYRMVSRYSR